MTPVESYITLICLIVLAISFFGFAKVNEIIVTAQNRRSFYEKKLTVRMFTYFFILAAITLIIYAIYLFYPAVKMLLLLSLTITATFSVITLVKYKRSEYYFKRIEIAVDEIEDEINAEKTQLVKAIKQEIESKVRSLHLKKELINSLDSCIYDR